MSMLPRISPLLVSTTEWNHVAGILKKRELASTFKISRKDHPGILKHSFIALIENGKDEQGKTIKQYRTFAIARHHFLGEGCFGRVKLIEAQNGQKYALKVSSEPKEVVSKSINKRNEVDLLRFYSQLVAEFGLVGKKYSKGYIIQTYHDGMLLSDYLAQYQLSAKQKNELAFQICLAVKKFHEDNCIHADLKHYNMIITCFDENPLQIKLIDFGSSIQLKSNQTSVKRYICGTRFFLPAELNKEYDQYLVNKRKDASIAPPKFNLSKEIDVFALNKLFQCVIQVEGVLPKSLLIKNVTEHFESADRQPLPVARRDDSLIAKYKCALSECDVKRVHFKKKFILKELKEIILQSNDIKQLKKLFDYLNESESLSPFLTKERKYYVGQKGLTASWREVLGLLKKRALFLAEQELASLPNKSTKNKPIKHEDKYQSILHVNRSRLFYRQKTRSEVKFESLKARYLPS